MNEEFNIDCKWLGGRRGSAIEESFYSDIGLAIGGEWLTQLEEREASTVRTHMRGCAYQLAMWFAANWWRLRWEPETRGWVKDSEWRVAHSVAGAGGGYVWPNVLFASDGDSIAVASLTPRKGAVFEPVRYFNAVRAQILAVEFEQKVDLFLERVLSRLNSRAVADTGLPKLWGEVVAERNDPMATAQRKFEALAGFDPDDAPEALLEQLLNDWTRLGNSAVEEVTAEARHAVAEVLKPLRELAVSKQTKPGGFRVSVPAIADSNENVAGRPWQRGAALARLAREQWGLGDKPVKNRMLADILSAEGALFTNGASAKIQIPVAVRKQKAGDFDIYLNSHNPTTRRFAVCRMIGDHLYFANQERLIPTTHTKTSRQKIQRAFAQEFLCPIDALRAKIQTEEPDEDDIADAATYFHVSPLLVRTTLVNKGELDREALTWTD